TRSAIGTCQESACRSANGTPAGWTPAGPAPCAPGPPGSTSSRSSEERSVTMAIPPALTTITVTGTYMSASGTALNGSVMFTPTWTLYDKSDQVIFGDVPVVATVAGGTFSVVLPTTDNAHLYPAGWAYQVQVSVPGSIQLF